MKSFKKDIGCPSSHELLCFQKRELSDFTAEHIREHLERCDFCDAEVEFYAHFPQAEEVVADAKIPRALAELAEALLSHKYKDSEALQKIVGDYSVV